MTTTYGVDAEERRPATSTERRRPRRVSVEFVQEALDALLDGAVRTGLSNGDFPVEAVRAVNAQTSWEDRGYTIIARGPDGREITLSPIMLGIRPPGS